MARLVRWAVRGGAAAVAVVGLALAADPAAADVRVTPEQAVRGEAAMVTFRVAGDRHGAYTTKVELILPASAPIPEVYPMSVADWGPQVTMRSLATPLGGPHGGQITQVASAITWTRMASPGPVDVADLAVSMGPMPEVDRLLFSVTQTYSDGTVVFWGTPASAEPGNAEQGQVPVALTLVPAGGPSGAAAGGASPGGAAGADRTPDAAVGATTGMNGSVLLILGLIGVLGVGLAVLGWILRRERGVRAVTATPPSGAPETGAPRRRSAWRLHE
jgi:uncharacterized protein YcnI